MKNHNIPYETAMKRSDAFEQIIEHGKISQSNETAVLKWIDDVVLEGIKDVHVRYFPLDQKMKVLLRNQNDTTAYFSEFIAQDTLPHLCSNQYDKDFTLVSVRWMGEGKYRRVVFTYCKKLFTYETAKTSTSIKPIDYPIIVEYYIDGEWLLIMAKPRSNLYVYDSNGFDVNDPKPTTTDKEVDSVLRCIEQMMPLEKIDRKTSEDKLKKKLFYILDKYTRTPKEIEDAMTLNETHLDTISRTIADICYIQDKCYAPSLKDIIDDIKNIAEKYFSINWHDSQIFTQDRDAYPVKLKATDEEDSKVKQTSSSFEPLQKKSIFFDNKKMLQKNKSCDGVTFYWRRKNGKNPFPVSIDIKNGVCIFKFTQFTAKEDIENVIFSIIGANEETDKS